MSSFNKPIQSEQGYSQLRRLLMTGQIAPGSRLVETEWAQRLGVHRPALREAMRVLAHGGLLESGEKGGFFVPEMNECDLKEILEVRALVETGAIRRLTCEGDSSFAAASDNKFKPLGDICDMMAQLLEIDLEFGFVEADRKFHETLVSITGNNKLLALYRQAPLPIRPSPESNHTKRREEAKQTLIEHRQLVELLEQGRTIDAIELLEKHLHVSAAMPSSVY